MNTVFYSWQGDRPGAVCRNFIERALQSAIDRLRANYEVDVSIREDLELDKDTKDEPGTPAVFDTILKKIDAANRALPSGEARSPTEARFGDLRNTDPKPVQQAPGEHGR